MVSLTPVVIDKLLVKCGSIFEICLWLKADSRYLLDLLGHDIARKNDSIYCM
jgi:hypothetical protein